MILQNYVNGLQNGNCFTIKDKLVGKDNPNTDYAMNSNGEIRVIANTFKENYFGIIVQSDTGTQYGGRETPKHWKTSKPDKTETVYT